MSHTQPDSAQLFAEVSVGEVLAGKYRVDRILGRGGMGIVVAATHLELGSPVAIKLLLPEVRGNQEIVARFAREARAAAQITSEFVARTIDVGRLDNGCPYIVMEYLDGYDLAQRIAQHGPLAYPEAVKLVVQACEALREAHDLGIIHRDLKPSNLFLARRRDGSEVTKLLDFGISKVTSVASTGSDPSMTRTSSMMGSPLYMSPEQLVAARNVDHRTDVWALGVTLYEALAGQPPFLGESLPELCARVMTQAPSPIEGIRPDLPPQLAAIIMRCLEKSPDARFSSATELGQALRPFAPQATSGITDRGASDLYPAMAGMPQANPRGGVPREGSRPDLGSAVMTANSWGQTNDPPVIPKSSNKGLLLAVTLVVGLVVVGVVVVSRLNQSGTTTTRTSASNEQAHVIASSVPQLPSAATVTDALATAVPSIVPIASAVNVNVAKNAPVPVGPRLGPSARQPTGAPAAKAGSASPQRNKDLFSDRN